MRKVPHGHEKENDFDLESICADFFMLFKELLPELSLRKVEREQGVIRYRDREPVFTLTVVIWMMMYQRLSSKHTMSEVVRLLKAGRFEQLHTSDVWCKKCSKMSLNTSGYSQARSQLEEPVVQIVVEKVHQLLFEEFDKQFLWHGRRVWLCDGSSISAPHTEDILNAYPASINQHGASYWPVARVLVMHDLLSGIATTPTWGPMYGLQAVSEQSLFKEHVKMLPEPGVILGDGNFGVFSVGYHALCSGHDVVLRLSEPRAKSLDPSLPLVRGERRITWKPTGADLRNNQELRRGAELKGRIVVGTVKPKGRKKRVRVILFTTLRHSAKKILKLYEKRWWIETDLKTIKDTVDMDILNVKTAEMFNKELLVGVTAYSLVRATMALAALREGKDPRRLSFSHTLDVIHAHLPSMMKAKYMKERTAIASAVLREIALSEISPRKRKRKSQPRVVRFRRTSFAYTTKSRKELEKDFEKMAA